MQKRRLGKTDLWVSPLGLGTTKFGRNQGVHYPKAFELPTDKTISRLLSIARDHGINILDTAPAYGACEERLGRLLNDTRKEWVIVTKAGERFHHGKSYFDFSKAAIKKSVETSLSHLKTDYLDLLLVHSNGNDASLIQEEKVFETLKEIKQSGKIRCFGMSTKTVRGGLLTVRQSDAVMMTYHPHYQNEYEVIRHAETHHTGVLIKKALASGHQIAIEETMQFILKEKAISSVIVGTIDPLHLMQNINLFTKGII